MTEWQNIKLGDVCSITMGTSPKGEDINTLNGMPFFQGSAEFGNRYPTVAKFTLNPIRLAKKGDILFSVRAPVGDLNIANIDCCIGRGLCAIRAIDFSLQHFVEYALLLTKNKWSAINDSGSVFGCAKRNDLLNFEIPWTKDVVVLKQIAGILGALDDKIEVLREQNKTLEQMAQAVFQSWFVDFDIVLAKAAGMPIADICKKYRITPDICDLFPSAFTPDNLPLGWEKKKLGDEFKITMGQSPAGNTYNEEKKGIPFFQGRRDFGFRYPTDRVYCTAPTRFAEKGDVLVSVRAPVGDLNIAKTECCIGRGVAAVRHYTGNTAYTFYHLKNLSNDFEVFNGNGTVFGCIGKDDFLNLSFISCPQKTLEKLLPFFDAFENKIYENSKQIRTLEQTRDALLPRLLGGKIDVENVPLHLLENEI